MPGYPDPVAGFLPESKTPRLQRFRSFKMLCWSASFQYRYWWKSHFSQLLLQPLWAFMVCSLLARILAFSYRPKGSYLASKVYPHTLLP